jgi:hypothetical protein
MATDVQHEVLALCSLFTLDVQYEVFDLYSLFTLDVIKLEGTTFQALRPPAPALALAPNHKP